MYVLPVYNETPITTLAVFVRLFALVAFLKLHLLLVLCVSENPFPYKSAFYVLLFTIFE